MSPPLTKADILRGARGGAEEVEIEGLGMVLLRPITDGEYEYAQALTAKALSAMADVESLQKQIMERKNLGQSYDGLSMKMNIGTYSEAEAEARFYVAACSLSVKEKWSVEEVKRMKPGIPAKIAQKAYEMSGVRPGGIPDLIPFRPEPGRTGNLDTA